MLTIKRLSLALAVTALVAGCSSGVKLDDKPVDGSLSSQGAGASGQGQSGVSGVDLTGSAASKAGPQGVSRIVYFDFDSYTVRPADRSIIESHAQWLRSHPGQAVMLQGHTDVRGGIEYNLALGQKRAESVRKSLELMGVDASRLEAVSYGKERLADHGTSDAAHQRNRRVEFSYQ